MSMKIECSATKDRRYYPFSIKTLSERSCGLQHYFFGDGIASELIPPMVGGKKDEP